jgi:hypothetical protein
MNWRPFTTHDGTLYKLTHLNAFEVHYTQAAQDQKPERLYKVLVSFGHHCFTRAPDEDEAKTLAYPHGPKHEIRLFDLERYELSKRLPDIIKNLMRRSCFHTGRDDGTFFTIELVNENGDRIEYEVYFKVFRNQQNQLRLIVESAFRRDLSLLKSRPRKGSIGFAIILYNTQQGKRIRAPR